MKKPLQKLFLFILCLQAVAMQAQNIGIGTINPTAQLHTNGTVRHAILSGSGTDCSLFVSNPRGSTVSPNYSVKIIAIGAQ